MRRGSMWRVVGLALALVATVLVATEATAMATTPLYQKYCVVRQPEKLTQVAEGLLGDAGRATEIFNLNRGRTQPDGGKLTDPAAVLHIGWILVLPWDAWGTGMQVGLLPTPHVTRTTGTKKPAANNPGASTSPDASASPASPAATDVATSASPWALLDTPSAVPQTFAEEPAGWASPTTSPRAASSSTGARTVTLVLVITVLAALALFGLAMVVLRGDWRRRPGQESPVASATDEYGRSRMIPDSKK